MHTLFRILDLCSDHLDGTGAFVCFKDVLLKALSANGAKYVVAAKDTQLDVHTRSWNRTALLLIEGTTDIFSQWMDAFATDLHMPIMCDNLLFQLDSFLERQSLSVSRTVFTGLTKVLSETETPSNLERSSFSRSWQTWQAANPVAHVDDSTRNDGNQDALLAYLNCLNQLLRLTNNRLEQKDIRTTLATLRACIIGSTTSVYSSDIDQMTPVQKAVLESLRSIPTKNPTAVFELLDCITFLVTLAYKPNSDESKTKQTYVALSKASMSLLESFVSVHLEEPEIDFSDILTKTLIALAEPMHLKYSFQPTGKPPSPWRKSISTATAVLEMSSSLVAAPEPAQRLDPPFWDALVNIINGMLSANCNATNDISHILNDQDADIAAFSHLRSIVVPTLGSPFIADSIRKSYAATIFQNSLLHEPHPDDLPSNTDLLSGLPSSHCGRVQDLPPSPRSKLCYILLDDLFTLAASSNDDLHSSTSSLKQRLALAQATVPYLILRCGLTLKAYITDQPLRGRLPQPWSQKEEMLYILRKLIELDSEPRAIPFMAGVVSEHKRHLYRLYPLLMKALQAARRDEEMAMALREVLEVVGNDLGG